MTLALRRSVWPDGERSPDDYEIRHDGRTVGRICRKRGTGRELSPPIGALLGLPEASSGPCDFVTPWVTPGPFRHPPMAQKPRFYADKSERLGLRRR